MRLCARNLTLTVTPAPEATRSVQLRAAGLIYTLTPTEAIALSNQLADVVEQLEKETKQ